MISTKGVLCLGNLDLSIRPHVFISPPHILEQLQAAGFIQTHGLLARNQGSVLLEFLQARSVADIYKAHGLRHALDL